MIDHDEHGVFWAIKEMFVLSPGGCYPFDRKTFEEVGEGNMETD